MGTLEPEACRDAGYLCPGLMERDPPRILRWAGGTEVIHVRIPSPPVESRGRARELQDAAARGILAWQNKPFPLRVRRSDIPSNEDITVRWVETLEGTELGRAGTEWTRDEEGRMAMRVVDFVLALRNPLDRHRILDAKAVQLTAAHEMGHALGLPHSDSEEDVMYPTNTATALSPRDYRTVAALYALENGAVLSADALEGSR